MLASNVGSDEIFRDGPHANEAEFIVSNYVLKQGIQRPRDDVVFIVQTEPIFSS